MKKYVVFLFAIFLVFEPQRYCLATSKKNTIRQEIKSINEEILKTRKEFSSSKRKIKIKKYLQLNRLDKTNPEFKKNVKEIKNQAILKTKALRDDWRQKYKDFKQKKTEAIRRFSIIEKSMDEKESELKGR